MVLFLNMVSDKIEHLSPPNSFVGLYNFFYKIILYIISSPYPYRYQASALHILGCD